jgi:hypothetical protein
MPDPASDILARIRAIEAELHPLVLPVTMHTASLLDFARYHDLVRERDRLLRRLVELNCPGTAGE